LDKIDPRWDIPGSPEFIQNPGYPGLENLFQRYLAEKYALSPTTPSGRNERIIGVCWDFFTEGGETDVRVDGRM
jgi:hypothetical protein